jgi:hypothetical protein
MHDMENYRVELKTNKHELTDNTNLVQKCMTYESDLPPGRVLISQIKSPDSLLNAFKLIIRF